MPKETIILNSAHAMIMSHKPEILKMAQINEKLRDEPQEISQFGLFDNSTPNYTTYYPDVNAEDLQPKDSEFVEPVFRMLSNVTVHARFNPIYFPVDVLKASMHKIVGQTVNIDHEMAVGNAIGTVKSVEWQDSYKSKGVTIPAGFNAVLKIDGKSNPRIARGIMMDPPSIHANSVTVTVAWKQSHENMESNEFYQKLGTFDDKGKLIQKIATEITGFHETSLVSHGADPFAQKLDKDGKIVLPEYAKDRYPLAEKQLSYHSVDWKDIISNEYGETIMNSTSSYKGNNYNNYEQIKNSEKMKELLKFLETLFGLEAESLTEENVQEKLVGIDFAALKAKAEKADEPITILDLTGVEEIENEINTLRKFKENIPEDLEAQMALAQTGKTAIDNLRADTTRLYRLAAGEGKEDANILAMIESTDYKTLQSLHKQYDEATEEKFGFTCQDCGSHDVTRASASTGDGEEDDKTPKGREEVIDHFTGVNKVELPSWMKSKDD